MSNVIDIEELRFTRDKRIVRPREECEHKHMTMDDHGQFVRCDDCKVQLSPFWVLSRMLDQYERALSKIAGREQRQSEAERRTVHLRAAQVVERAWRSHTTVPTCPHCGAQDTVQTAAFSATACKSLHRCNVCREPFEQIKTI